MVKYNLGIGNKETKIHEAMLYSTLKVLKIRKPKLYNLWVNKIEDIEGKKFNEDDLEYY